MRSGGFGRAALLVVASSAILAGDADACPTCRAAVRAGIYDRHFGERLGVTVAPFAGTALVGWAAFLAARRRRGKDAT